MCQLGQREGEEEEEEEKRDFVVVAFGPKVLSTAPRGKGRRMGKGRTHGSSVRSALAQT